MTEQNPEQGHQDPAAPNEVDTSVDTSDQEATPEAPVAAEPQPVQVQPADQSEPKTVLGKDYEVTPDRGFRQVQEPSGPGGGEDSAEDSSDSES